MKRKCSAGTLLDVRNPCSRCEAGPSEPCAPHVRTVYDENKRLRADKDQAYFERNNVVAALARIYPSGVGKTDIHGWPDDWHGCVYIDLPTGQISYHFHDSQSHLFNDLPPYKGEWDGHDKDEVHRRLAALPHPDDLGRE